MTQLGRAVHEAPHTVHNSWILRVVCTPWTTDITQGLCYTVAILTPMAKNIIFG